jgi:hypothetical protein
MTEPEQKDYHSYLLRLWRAKEDGHTWRASLQEVQSGEVRGFTNQRDLFVYLEKLLDAEAETRLQENMEPSAG